MNEAHRMRLDERIFERSDASKVWPAFDIVSQAFRNGFEVGPFVGWKGNFFKWFIENG